MGKEDIDKMIDAEDFDTLNEKLATNPVWRKVSRFSCLQEIFLCISLVCGTIHVVFDAKHPFWIIGFLIIGILSLVFGRISMKTYQKYFIRKSDISEKMEEGN